MLKSNLKPLPSPDSFISVGIVDVLSSTDLSDLCDAADATIEAGGGFGWIKSPPRETLERYWKGVLAVPERHLLAARINGTICGAVQLVEPSRHNEAQAFAATLLASFVAPWAQRRGAASKLLQTAEKLAAEIGYHVLQADIRQSQAAALHLYEKAGYARWGVNPFYARIDNVHIAGCYYHKTITPIYCEGGGKFNFS